MSYREEEGLSEKDYVKAVLDLYVSLPATPERPRRDDRYVALELRRRGVSMFEVESALLLAVARRTFRASQEPLQPIRSLRYFAPVISEVREIPLTGDYVQYLRRKLEPQLRKDSQAPRRTTFSSGREFQRSRARQLRLPC